MHAEKDEVKMPEEALRKRTKKQRFKPKGTFP